MSQAPSPNTLLPLRGVRSVRAGDLPERLLARYYRETGAGEQRFYVDAQARTPAFRDLGRRLVTRRSDPNSVRDMAAIAAHRGWAIVEARGSPRFRREAWLAGQALGLEVRGHRPSERDRQALERRVPDARARARPQPSDVAAAERRGAAEAVIAARVVDPEMRATLTARARARIEAWLARGAAFTPLRPPERTHRHEPPERRRTH